MSSSGSASITGGARATGGAQAAGGTDVTPAASGAADGGEASAPAAGGAAASCGSYEACGCGCCAGVSSPAKCIYSDLGEDLSTIIAADQEEREDSARCAVTGCARGQTFVCCEAPPANNDRAIYETSVYVGGLDRIRLHKMGAMTCSTFALVGPSSSPPRFPVEVPSSWAIDQITRLPCSSSMAGIPAIGAVGNFSLRVSGNACVVDAHVTAFFGDAFQGVQAERFDAESVPLDIAIALCH